MYALKDYCTGFNSVFNIVSYAVEHRQLPGFHPIVAQILTTTFPPTAVVQILAVGGFDLSDLSHMLHD